MKEPRTETQRRRGSGAVINEISETIVDRAVKIHAALAQGYSNLSIRGSWPMNFARQD